MFVSRIKMQPDFFSVERIFYFYSHEDLRGYDPGPGVSSVFATLFLLLDVRKENLFVDLKLASGLGL